MMFQSPRSGKFESNTSVFKHLGFVPHVLFQSPRSGKFESNMGVLDDNGRVDAWEWFQSPRSGKFESNRL